MQPGDVITEDTNIFELEVGEVYCYAGTAAVVLERYFGDIAAGHSEHFAMLLSHSSRVDDADTFGDIMVQWFCESPQTFVTVKLLSMAQERVLRSDVNRRQSSWFHC